MQGSPITDTFPDITPLIRELSRKEEILAIMLFCSVARGHVQTGFVSDLLRS